jgi:hypothetical protein
MDVIKAVNSVLANKGRQGLANYDAGAIRMAKTRGNLQNALITIQRRYSNNNGVNILNPGLNVFNKNVFIKPKTRTVYRRKLGGKRRRTIRRRK